MIADALPMSAPVTVSSLPLRMLGEHTGTISAMLLGAARSLLPFKRPGVTGECITQTVPAPSAELRRAYAAWCGAGERYASSTPPHLVCAKITLPLVSQLTAQSPYPLLSVLNQGVRLRLHQPLPVGEAIRLSGSLIDASDDGYRARIHSRVEVGTASVPLAMTIDAMAAVMLKKRPDGENSDARVTPDFATIATWQAAANEGQTFFWLTGDFNPIHTLPAFARHTRFRGCIMHGYGAFAQVFEGLVNHGARIADIEVRFLRPLPLPSPPLLIQQARTADAQGRLAIRLIDTEGAVYQAGSFLPEENPL
ncbi:MAG: MaoC/PaaZ C-terminal domain-containing protein [bacterium]|nr:MaoC/PaaZ C-terminal domain-containing protein [bacterium]